MKITAVYDDSSKVRFAFNRYFIVPKLNSENDSTVQQVIAIIDKTASQMGAFATDANNIILRIWKFNVEFAASSTD